MSARLLPRLIVVFTVVPLVELALLIALGRVTGLAPTLALVLVTGVLGAALVRRQGVRVVTAVQAELAAGRLPAAAVGDGLLVLLAGVLLLTPGLLTDLAGFALLVPPLRARVVRFAAARVAAHVAAPPPGVVDVTWRRLD